jgi:alcohol dehydrogenase class IV
MKKLIQLLGASNSNGAKEILENLIIKCGLEIKLKNLGISTKEDINIIIKNGFNPQRVKNNPRLVTERDLRNILNKIK